jgi:hypothetical protein
MGHNSLGEWMIFSPAGLLKLKLSMCHVKVPEYVLVGGLEHVFLFFPYIGNFIIPTEFHIFQRG